MHIRIYRAEYVHISHAHAYTYLLEIKHEEMYSAMYVLVFTVCCLCLSEVSRTKPPQTYSTIAARRIEVIIPALSYDEVDEVAGGEDFATYGAPSSQPPPSSYFGKRRLILLAAFLDLRTFGDVIKRQRGRRTRKPTTSKLKISVLTSCQIDAN